MTKPLKAAIGVLMFMVSVGRLWSQSVTYEGYGYATLGGQGGDTYHVTTLADGGAGSLRDAVFNRTGPRIVVFDVAGVITLTNTMALNRPYLTIDGASAPAPGITITKASDTNEFFIAGTHDIILRHLRFKGLYPNGAAPGTSNTGIMGIDGDSSPDHYAHNIVVDHLTILNATDAGMDIWGEVSDVTVSWCLIADSFHPSTVSYYPAPFQKRRRISMHHNVWARNGERNPQLRADVADFDYVNNVVYDWGNYGVRIKNDPGEPQVSGNFVNNYFRPGTGDQTSALVYGLSDGPDANDGGPLLPVPQGTVITNSTLGNLWVAGNVLPVGNLDHYSTIPAPNPVPTNAQVTTYSADQLKDRVVPNVGMKYRSADEQTLLSSIATALAPPADLKILNVTTTNTVIEIDAQPGFLDELQFSESLLPPVWQSLSNFAGSGDPLIITNTNSGSSRFYRVITTQLQ